MRSLHYIFWRWRLLNIFSFIFIITFNFFLSFWGLRASSRGTWSSGPDRNVLEGSCFQGKSFSDAVIYIWSVIFGILQGLPPYVINEMGFLKQESIFLIMESGLELLHFWLQSLVIYLQDVISSRMVGTSFSMFRVLLHDLLESLLNSRI